ncbi:hypothetical protein [Mycetocola zhadangensis]|uniref:Uncharacterized protein n=1 Tax=Mycetocola zhadangensis TaxID=1164595 RepID=A0A3L7IX77_9MICO|nr:hypothetical protein [Mycetocola zhadangensis]RLQ82755.1 hypothetical protein D9V28_12460 [Mycetocola zhadangensis]GGE98466.1 hypothetical protein GCM10011313_21830 [Mycetocola zhadangensis]
MTATDTTTVTVHVRRSLLAQGIAALLALSIPIMIVLYWLTIPAGTWGWVGGAQAVVLVAVLIAAYRYTRASVTVTPTSVVEVRFFGGENHTKIEDIERVIMLEMHRTMASQSRLQMFVLDSNGRPLLRMRGEYWSRNSINRIAAQLSSAPIEHIDHPVTLDELQTSRPEMLYWFERRPIRFP